MTVAVDPWQTVKALHESADRVTMGAGLSWQMRHDPYHVAMVLARYRAAAGLIGDAQSVLEIGCGEGFGASVLAKGRQRYCGLDSDADAIRTARQTYGDDTISFAELDALTVKWLPGTLYDAVISLDVIEHVPPEHEQRFIESTIPILRDCAVYVVGTPNATAWQYGSEVSKAGHVNNYTHERLHALMSRYFLRVQSFGMQDVSLHFGHPDMRHYLLMAGIGLK